MKIENTNLNIPEVTVKEIVSYLSELYARAVNNGVPFKSFFTPFLWGPPGVGKSDAVAQIADQISKKTGKTVSVIDVSLQIHTPPDLHGFPVLTEDGEYCRWKKPELFKMDSSDDHVNIVFLDELSGANHDLQKIAYQICYERRVGEHHFPDNCIIIAAGNRTTDQCATFRMPKALCNRLMHFTVNTDYGVWREWAVANDVDPRIIGYLGFDTSKLNVESNSAETAYPTPRSWVAVSNLLKMFDGSVEDNIKMVSSHIGKETALEFSAWEKINNQLPDVDSVLEGRCRTRPGNHDALYAFMASLVSAIRSRKDMITVEMLDRACDYVNKFPVDYATCFYCDINAIEELRLKLMKCRAIREWTSKHKHIL